MPKIKITEKDNTGLFEREGLSNVVFIPGKTTKSNYSAVTPTLFYSVTEFTSAKAGYDNELVSYKIAKHLLRLGLPVLYEQVVTDISDWDYLADKNLYDIRFLTSGAEMVGSKAIIECAAKRGDCIALIDHGADVVAVDNLRTFFDGVLSKDEDADRVNSCAAGFTPWFTLAEVKSQPDLKETDWIPGSFGYLFAYAKSIQDNPEWYAAAGSFRGIIDNIKSLKKTFTMSEVEVLQGRSKTEEVELDDPNGNDNNGFAINVITRVNPFGDIVWGNRTLLENDGTLKATSFLNVRNLVSAVKKQLYFTAKKYTFEQNSDVLWVNFKSQLTPLLDQMQSGNGIAGYKIEKLPTTKKARLKAKITIIPIEAVEDFELEVELADSLEVVE